MKFCSFNCYRDGSIMVVACAQCTAKFRVHRSLHLRGKRSGKFCSTACYAAFQAGDGNPNWRGGGSYARGPEWKAVRIAIRHRDDFSCVTCGAKEAGRAHDVHHKIPWRISKDNSPENLVTLCMRCHRRETARELAECNLQEAA